MTNDLLDAVHTRLVDIVCNGHGVTGVSALATERSIPSGQFRYSDAPLNDAGVSGSLFHRAVHIEYVGDEDIAQLSNDYDPISRQTVRFQLSAGYLRGIASNLVHKATTGESDTTAVQHPSRIAIADGWRIRRALMCPDMRSGVSPTIVDIVRENATVADVGNGRVIATQQFAMRLTIDFTAAWTP